MLGSSHGRAVFGRDAISSTSQDKSVSPVQRKRERSFLRRWIGRLFRVMVLVIALGALAQWLIAPTIARRIVVNALENAGLGPAELNIDRISLVGFEADAIVIGSDPWLHISSVRIDYNLLDLLRGRVRGIEILGLQWRIRERDGVFDFGPAMKGESETAWGEMRWPFKSLSVRSAEVLLDRDGLVTRIPMEVTADAPSPELLNWRLRGWYGGDVFDLSGKAHAADGAMQVEAKLESRAEYAAMSPGSGSGAAIIATATARLTKEVEEIKLNAELRKPKQEWLVGDERVVVEDLHVRLRGLMGSGIRIEEIAGDVEAGAVHGFGMSAHKVGATLRDDGTQTLIAGEALIEGGPKALVRVQGPTVAALMREGKGEHEVSGRFDVDGPLPHRLLEVLALQGVLFQEEARVRIGGDAAVKIALREIDSDSPMRIDGTLTNGMMEASPFDVSLAAESVLLRGAEAKLAFAANVQGGSVSLLLESGCVMSVMDVTGPGWASVVGAETQSGETAMRLGLESPATITFELENPRQSMRAEVPGVRLHVPGRDWGLAGIELKEVAGELLAAIDGSGDHWTATLRQGALSIATITSDAEQPWETAGVEMALRADAPIHALFDAKDGTITTRGGISTNNAVSFSGPNVAGSVGPLRVAADATWQAETGLALESRLTMTDGTLHFAESNTRLIGIDIDLPIRWNRSAASGSESGAFSVARLVSSQATLPGLAGTVEIEDGMGVVRAMWPLVDGVTLNLSGRGGLGASGFEAELTTTIPPSTIGDRSAIAAMVPVLGDLQIGGNVRLDGELRINGGELDGAFRAELRDMSLESQSGNYAAGGLSSTITIDSIAPLQSPVNQRVTIKRANIGSIDFSDAVVTFAVEDIDSILVSDAQWDMGPKGRFRATAFRLNPQRPEIHTELYGENMSLAEWLPLVSDGRARGEGRLYGHVPFAARIRAEGVELAFGNGYLFAEPGGGYLEVDDAMALEELLESQDPRFRTDETLSRVKRNIVDALRDFEYSMLRVDLVKEREGVTASIATSGKGRRGNPPQEIGSLNVNIRGFDQLLNDLIMMQASMRRSPQSMNDNDKEAQP